MGDYGEEDRHSIEKIVRVAAQAIKEELNILTDEEHAFLKAWVLREKRATERWENIKTQVLGWGALALAGWLGKIILDAVVQWVRK